MRPSADRRAPPPCPPPQAGEDISMYPPRLAGEGRVGAAAPHRAAAEGEVNQRPEVVREQRGFPPDQTRPNADRPAPPPYPPPLAGEGRVGAQRRADRRAGAIR